MLLVEIAVQGLKAALWRAGSLRLRPGYNVLATEGAALRLLVRALVRPAVEDRELLGAGPGARLGATLVGEDGATYRLVRDFGAGLQLQRYEPQRRAFAPAGPVQAPGAGAAPPGPFTEPILVESAELPSRWAPDVASAAEAGGPPPARPAAAARRPELEAELARARRAEELQGALDLLHARLFALEEAGREERRLAEAAAAAGAALEPHAAALRALEAWPEAAKDVAAAFAAHARAQARLDEVLRRAEEERAACSTAPAPANRSKLWFWGGLGAAAVAVVAAAAGSQSAPALRYLALLDLPALGLSAWTALGWVAAAERRERAARRLLLVGEHERKGREAFEAETRRVREAQRQVEAASPEELRERLEAAVEARALAAKADAELARSTSTPEAVRRREERARLEREARELEARLAELAAGYVRESGVVEAELRRLEAEEGPGAAQAGARPAPAPAPGARSARRLGAAGPEPLAALLARAAGELGGSPAGALRELSARASQLAEALTANRLSHLAADERGGLRAQVSGRALAYAELAPHDRDAAYLAVKLAWIERALAGGRRLAVIDEALAVLPEPGRRAAGRALKAMARGGQILHATTDPVLRESADHVA